MRIADPSTRLVYLTDDPGFIPRRHSSTRTNESEGHLDIQSVCYEQDGGLSCRGIEVIRSMHRSWTARLAIVVTILCVTWFECIGNGAAQGSTPVVTSRGSIASVDCHGASFALKGQAGS